jgi:predicted Fe-S protein YdhL (DUF1289 family)
MKYETSPCTYECGIDLKTGLCKGCFRTIEEIKDWALKDRDERKQIYRNIKRRIRLLDGGSAE